MANIRVDIDELSEKLDAMREDDFVTVELEIDEDDYISELKVSAISLEADEPIGYGTLSEISDELF